MGLRERRQLTPLERDISAGIKQTLGEMEKLAAAQPADVNHPYKVEQRRAKIMDRFWGLYRAFCRQRCPACGKPQG